jgi:PhnB protein
MMARLFFSGGPAMAVKPIPDGYHSVTPHLIVRDSRKAVDFYKRAFGAEEIAVMTSPDGKVMHAEIKIGDSIIMFNDEFPEWGSVGPETLGNCTSSLHIYVPDVDAAFQKAVQAGATPLMPPADMFWGDRYGKLKDPFGHQWAFATHKEDMSEAEMQRRGDEFFKQMAAAGQKQ